MTKKRIKNKYLETKSWVRKISVMLTQKPQDAFVACADREPHPRGSGLWVYYDSYADFKEQQKKTRFLGWSGVFIVVSVVIISFAINMIFPTVFKSEASNDLVWTQESQADFLSGKADNNLDLFTNPGEIRLKRNLETKKIDDRFDYISGYTPKEHAMSSANVIGLNEAKIVLNQGYAYNSETPVKLGGDIVNHSWFDPKTAYLYVSTKGGLAVIDTASTIEAKDDKLVINYNNATEPKLDSINVYHSWMDHRTDFLYVSTLAGLVVIDTKGTKKTSDDEIVKVYNSSSEPRIAYNNVRYSYLDLDTNLLYICTNGGGLAVINTHGTKKTSDDNLVLNYNKESKPALSHNRVYHVTVDSQTLYISTYGGGVNIINTAATIDPSDDELVEVFKKDTFPSVGSDKISSTFLDKERGALYVNTYGGGLSVIDVEKNELIQNYSTTSAPPISHNYVSSSWLDRSSGFLYVATNGGGISLINTHLNNDPSDDLAITVYDTGSAAALASNNITHFNFNTKNNLIYAASEDGGLSVLSPGKYNQEGVYVSKAMRLSDFLPEEIVWTEEKSDSQGLNIQTRIGKKQAVWEEEFINDDIEKVVDLWGTIFPSVWQDEGILYLSGKEGSSGGASWQIEASKSSDYFAAGSEVRVKLKIETSASDVEGVLFTDAWEANNTYFSKTNEWLLLKLSPSKAFKEVGFSLSWPAGSWQKQDRVLIDYVVIENESINWDKWSERKSNSKGSIINTDFDKKGWFQYKINLSTQDVKKTPEFNKVALRSGFQSFGTYVSPVINAGRETQWKNLKTEAFVPNNTLLRVFSRSGNEHVPDYTWSEWQEVEDEILSPVSNYFQYRAEFSTKNPKISPVLYSVSITHMGSIYSDESVLD